MKKIIAILLAMLMLALPALGMGEGIGSMANQAANYSRQFSAKYLLEGQQREVEFSLQPGEGLLNVLPEELQAPLRDLLQVLSVQVTGQTAERMAQGALRLKMSGETVADVIGALDGESRNLYAASSLLGDGTTVLRITPAQTKGLLNRLGDELVSRGYITQDQLDMAKRGYRALRNDPAGTLTSLVGQPDFGPLMEAIQALTNSPMEVEEVTEKPDDLIIEPTMVLYIQVEKDTLQRLATEAGRLLWSIPAIQKLAAFVSTDARAITEETLVNKLSALPNSLTDDVGIRLYIDESGQAYQLQAAAPVERNGQPWTEYTDLLLDMREETPGILGVTSIIGEGEDPLVVSARYSMELTRKADGLSVEAGLEVSRSQGEEQTYLVVESVQADLTRTEDRHSMTMDMAASMLNPSTGEPLDFEWRIVSEERDMGDHAEGESSATLTVNGIGEVMTVNTAFRTDLAEAYIVTENALEPLGNAEDRAALEEMVQNVPSTLLVQLLPLVPDSVRTMLFGMIGF